MTASASDWQRVQQRTRLLLAQRGPFLGVQVLELRLDLVNAGELRKRILGNLALVGGMQVEKLVLGMRQAPRFGHPCWKPAL
jgi:hypothetical protein